MVPSFVLMSDQNGAEDYGHERGEQVFTSEMFMWGTMFTRFDICRVRKTPITTHMDRGWGDKLWGLFENQPRYREDIL